MISKFISVLMVVAMLHPMLFAGPPALPDAPSTVQARLKGDLSNFANQQKKVTVRLNNAGKVTGTVQSLEDDRFVLSETKTGETKRISYDDVANVRKAGMSAGAKVLIGAGIVAGAMIGLTAIACHGLTGCD